MFTRYDYKFFCHDNDKISMVNRLKSEITHFFKQMCPGDNLQNYFYR